MGPRRFRWAAPTALLSTLVVAASGLGACSRASGGSRSVLPLAEVSQRYQAAMGPTNGAVSDIVTQALAFQGSSPSGLATAARRAEAPLKDAAHQLGGISTPQPIGRDITDVTDALNAVVGDLTALAGATGADIETDIARLVADSGRLGAGDNLARLALNLTPAPAPEPPTTVTTSPQVTVAPLTITVPRRSTTTRPRTTGTTRAPATTATTLKH